MINEVTLRIKLQTDSKGVTSATMSVEESDRAVKVGGKSIEKNGATSFLLSQRACDIFLFLIAPFLFVDSSFFLSLSSYLVRAFSIPHFFLYLSTFASKVECLPKRHRNVAADTTSKRYFILHVVGQMLLLFDVSVHASINAYR